MASVFGVEKKLKKKKKKKNSNPWSQDQYLLNIPTLFLNSTGIMKSIPTHDKQMRMKRNGTLQLLLLSESLNKKDKGYP